MSTDLWPAPLATTPIDAVVVIPGSKSLTARALLLASLAEAPSRLSGVLDSRDTRLFAQALRMLGGAVNDDGAGNVIVEPLPYIAVSRNQRDFTEPGVSTERGSHTDAATIHIDCGLAGTVMRFLPPIATLTTHKVHFDGDPAARRRPLAPLLDALERLGAQITYDGAPGFLPFTICGPVESPPGGVLEVDAAASSQFVSALLMFAPAFNEPLTLRAAGEVVSLPHIEMTVDALQRRGVKVIQSRHEGRLQWSVTPARINALHEHIEPDLSNAGPFLAAAHLSGGRVTIPAWPEHTTQAGDAWRRILPRLGATITVDEAGLHLQGPGQGMYDGIDIDLSAVGELTPTLAALLLFARTPSTIVGVAHLRGHETDRLAALVEQIRRLGGDATERPDGIRIIPRPLKGTRLATYEDHRMATFAAIVGLGVPDIEVENIGTTSKTLPNFAHMWHTMLAAPTHEAAPTRHAGQVEGGR
ncbi:3-phosphoshikimate 1-carboxyvinyltransferase [Schaalia suimastitidis]|uniref:3-phosphoshikimate 1-carboxyvinyltransferase n=1 Tax=Schaalia suimastitidis TaxID=121163 RepID=UPI0004092343|nr:3-phosphoshikimate 1-carboxyvinyltransferase [Schaalia suimastitidis]